MKPKFNLLFFLFLFMFSNLRTQVKTVSNATLSKLEIDNFIKDQMNRLDIPGFSLAIINDANVVYYKNFGLKDISKNSKVDNKTLFEAASMTKPVFAYTVMKLVEKGDMDLDRPLHEYLPFDDIAHDERYEKITARMVLSHTTGFPNWRTKKFNELEILFEPGTSYSYSGEAFGYLGKVVSHITNKNLEQLIKEEVFEPFNMTQSSFIWNENLEKNKATGYFSNNIPSKIYKPLVPHMAGNLHTESIDFAKFIIALMNEKGLSKYGYQELLKRQVALPENHEFIEEYGQSEWGLGFARGKTPYGTFYSHGGSNGDFESYFEFFKEQKTGYVFFTNCGKGALLNTRLKEFLRTGVSVSAELDKTYEVVNRAIRKTEVKQKSAIELFKTASGDGLAWLRDTTFSEGTIEFDVMGNNREGESFVGIAFYGENNSTFDCLYFRPYLFDTENQEEKKGMVQYLSLPEYGFYRLRDERPYEFESELKNPPQPEDWFHVRIEIKGDQMKVFVNNAIHPDLKINVLSERKSGKIGFWVGYMSSGRFANLKLSKD